MNSISIDGRITKDFEVKMSNNKEVLPFTIANQKDKDTTNFINCIAFGNNVKFITKYFKKGDGINIEGELSQRTYKNKEGKDVSTLNVLVNSVSFPLSHNIQKEEEPQNDNFKDDKILGAKDIEIPPEDLPFYN